MKPLLHIYGASGSGTSTLGRYLAEQFQYAFLDSDDYFWLPTDPKFTTKRPIEQRVPLIRQDIAAAKNGAVLSGSLVGWGDALIPDFTLAVRVVTDTSTRLARIKQREYERFGARILPDGDMYDHHQAFLQWAAGYDDGGRHCAPGRDRRPCGGIAMLCKLTPEEEVRMHILLKGIADDPNALEMQKFIQHGSVTTYEHCLRVTRIAFWLNIHLHVRADEASLVKGAFLHDFYLYDWHNCSNITHWHGFKHARIARYNAETVFKLTDKEKDIIQSHMWPLNPTDIPHSREAALVCMADKMSSSYETVLERKAKRKK